MVCDVPDAYINQPGFDFVQKVPTTWDETRVIDAKPGEWVAIARRKGADWYIGAITNHNPRTITKSLGFFARRQLHRRNMERCTCNRPRPEPSGKRSKKGDKGNCNEHVTGIRRRTSDAFVPEPRLNLRWLE